MSARTIAVAPTISPENVDRTNLSASGSRKTTCKTIESSHTAWQLQSALSSSAPFVSASHNAPEVGCSPLSSESLRRSLILGSLVPLGASPPGAKDSSPDQSATQVDVAVPMGPNTRVTHSAETATLACGLLTFALDRLLSLANSDSCSFSLSSAISARSADTGSWRPCQNWSIW
jgi:hypothetical protein